MIAQQKKTLVVIGNGMVGQKFLDCLVEADPGGRWQIVTFCEEPQLAYDRVHLSEFFSGKGHAELALTSESFYETNAITVLKGERVLTLDLVNRNVVSDKGTCIRFDKVVLATGSYPFVPPIEGRDGPGCFVYRTLEDLERIRNFASGCRRGVVVGGGLLGLEAANALRLLGLETHVVEFANRLMPVQIDAEGGAILRRKIEALGVQVHLGQNTRRIDFVDGRPQRLLFADEQDLPIDLVLFSAGIRPRDELARSAGLVVGPRGGIVIDDYCRTSDPDVLAIGECALWKERIFGLVAPGYAMAQVAVATLLDRKSPTFNGADLSTKLKLMGVDVASFGDAQGQTPGARSYRLMDELGQIYKKIVLAADAKRLLGGILIGDAEAYDDLLQLYRNGQELPAQPEALILPAREGIKSALGGPEVLSDEAQICSCHNVSKGRLCEAIAAGATELGALKKCTKAGTGCGGCLTLVGKILNAELKKRGVEVENRLCEHFAYTRQQLFHLVKVKKIQTFEALLKEAGQGRGCEICKPAVASILAACWNEYILKPEHAGLQDTNDYFLANMQRDGTYSVVPRIPGGEILPEKLIVLGQIAQKYDLYTKITGGQRIDLFGAKAHELPEIWRELTAAGFESGHAYGKALRTVKSCVGSTWCRYGVQDSVGLAIRLEHRYKGLRAPHKLKLAVSGCTRECAEAQSKDVGVIATQQGYNLYVCGNGGMKPRHADLLATDLDESSLVKLIDRFLMFYVRTADRLQRTSTWLESLEGGLGYLRQVILEDKLGVCEELEADMQRIVGTYRCEWKVTIDDPERLKRFKTFVNAEGEDERLQYVRERGQRRPAYPHEQNAPNVEQTAANVSAD